MNRWIQSAAVVAGVAIVLVIVADVRQSSQAAAWTRLGEARSQENQIEALESAREAAGGTDAEPWIAFDLTLALYDGGTSEDLKRAAQVAEATMGEYPDHPVGQLLEDILPALKSYVTASGG